jgi:dUTP pyrophosphatase
MSYGYEESCCDRLGDLEEDVARLLDLLVNPCELPFKRLHPDAQLPHKSGDDEACYDFCCVVDDEFNDYVGGTPFFILKPGHSHTFRTGLACAIPRGRAMYLWDRSGMGAKRKIHRLAGVIDCTYRGEWLVSLVNLGHEERDIHAGDKIVQGQLALVIPGVPGWVKELPDSYRGSHGFGSTGR